MAIIDLKSRYCNICKKTYKCHQGYRIHMANRNNIHIPFTRPKLKPNPMKTPDINDPNYYCISCDHTFESKRKHFKHLASIHHMSHPVPSREPREPENKKPKIDDLNLYCDVCQKAYCTKINYLRHLAQFHRVTVTGVYLEPRYFDSKRLFCKVCDIRYTHKLKFFAHLRDAHRTVPPACLGLTPDTNDPNNYSIACNTTLSKRQNYVHHLAAFHLNEKPELYQGIYCKRPSKEDITYERYCGDCQKVFLSKRLHQVHMDKIHGIKLLENSPNGDDPDVNNPNNYCASCNRTYSCKGTFRSHLINVYNSILTPSYKEDIEASNIAPVVDV
ncbi:hypothetical protein EDC94DRAFT_432811 [Helicostylum pulchrum]|nr:hypothetical protein EDC94DRAFT_432811 [Helicostylum pulchrum]